MLCCEQKACLFMIQFLTSDISEKVTVLATFRRLFLFASSYVNTILDREVFAGFHDPH